MYLKKDSDGHIGIFAQYQVGWSPASTVDPPVSQADIDAYELKVNIRPAKIREIKSKLITFRTLGFVYAGWTFNLSERSALYAKSKRDDDLGGIYKYRFYDIAYVKRNFETSTAFHLFVLALEEEEERLMEKYNNYRKQAKDAATAAAINAITVNYNA